MRPPGVSWSAWLEALGIHVGGDDPPVADSIQPVRIVGIDELHAPRLTTAEGIFSLDFAAIPGAQNACSILSLAPGGMLVTAFYAFAFTGTDPLFNYNVQTLAPAYNYNTAPTSESDPRFPCRARRNQTNPLAAAPAEISAEGMFLGGLATAPAIVSTLLYGPIWVPPGRTFNLFKHGWNLNLRWGGHVRVREFEAPPSSGAAARA